jgi:hypothetical protein
MNTLRHGIMKTLRRWALCLALAASWPAWSWAGDVVYENTNAQVSGMERTLNEYGEDITLASGPKRIVTEFLFKYYLGGTISGAETVRLRFYAPTNEAPGSLLFDSGQLALTNGFGMVAVNPGVEVPDTFIYTVQFQAGAGAIVGLVITGPPTVGSSGNAFWIRGQDGWRQYLYSGGALPANFHVRVSAANQPDEKPPVITRQPRSWDVTAGTNLALQVFATGSAPLACQWQRSGVDIPGATGPVLAFQPVEVGQAGVYRVAISNAFGLTLSAPAHLYVSPVVYGSAVYDNTANPLNLDVYSAIEFGDQITLAGPPGQRVVTCFKFDYTWSTNATGNEVVRLRFYDNQGLSNAPGRLLYQSAPLAVTNGSHTLKTYPNLAVPDTFTWTVAVDNSEDRILALRCYDPPSLGSAPATYWEHQNQVWTLRTINGVQANFNAQVIADYDHTQQPPGILSQPLDTLATNGLPAALEVELGGTIPLFCQWWFNGQPIGETNRTWLQFPSLSTNQAGLYWAVISNAYGAVTSRVATLTVLAPPVITSQPLSQSLLNRGQGYLSVAASGTPPLAFQWLKDGEVLVGENRPQLLFRMVDASLTGTYQVEVSNSAGTAASQPARVEVADPAENQVAYDNLTHNLEKMRSTINEVGDQVTLAGSALERYVTEFKVRYYLDYHATGAETVRVRFYDANGPKGAPKNLLYDSGLLPAKSGTNDLVITPGVEVPGEFDWTVKLGGVSEQRQAGLLFYGPPAVGASATNFWERLDGVWSLLSPNETAGTNSLGNFGARVTAGPRPGAPAILLQPASLEVVAGQEAWFGVTVQETRPLQYQWFFNGEPLAGATGKLLTLPAVTASQAGVYHVVMTNYTTGATSAPASLVVRILPPVITVPLANLAGAWHGSAVFVAGVSGTAPIACQWLLNGSILPGATNTTLALTNLAFEQAGVYTFSASNSAGVAQSEAVLSITDQTSMAGLLVAGEPGARFRIEYQEGIESAKGWNQLDTLTLTNRQQWYFDVQSTGLNQRFYRAIQLP